MKISVYTLGCKLNQAESEELKKELEKKYNITDFKNKSDISIIRACAVTHGASQRTRQMIRSAKRKGAYTIALGCLENKDLKEIDFLAKNNKEIIDHIENKFPNKNTKKIKNKTRENIRKFIKIQNGCNFNCAYCIIPHFRGKNTSFSEKEILKKIKKIEKENIKEIVLTGVNICQYNYKKINLTKLLKKILSETNIKRIRLGSLDPRLITDELIKIFENKKMMPHVHLSLQSGSDNILKKMNRYYSTNKYFEIIKKFKKINKDFSFTTDIIVAFPSESDKDFEKTCNFIEKIGFSKIHVFPYSKRPGTKAEKMDYQVKEKIKKQRVKKLIEIAKKTERKYLENLKGKEKEILIEGQRNDFYEGYSPEFTRVKIKSDNNITNKIIKYKL